MGKTANFYHVFSIKRHKNLTYYDNAKSPELYKRHYSNFIVCLISLHLKWKHVVSWGAFELSISKVGRLHLCTGKRDVGIETLPNYWLYTKIDETYNELGSSLNVSIIIAKKISIYTFWKKVNKSFFHRWLLYCWIEYIKPTAVKCV